MTIFRPNPSALSPLRDGSVHYVNPVMAGDWSDPGVIRVGEDYYSCRSSFGWQPGIPIVHSRDLIHWRYIGHAFASHPSLRSGDTHFGFWGLEMGHNPNTGDYLIYAPVRKQETFVFWSSRPEGPYEMKGFGRNLGIDPGFLADTDGRLYLTTKLGVVYEMSRDGLSIEREAARIDTKPYKYFEGPDIVRRGDFYYILFSDGGTLPHEPSTISTLRARAIEGPWEEDPGNPAMFSTDNGAKFQGPAHGTLIETQRGEWWITYHAHEIDYHSLGRQMLLQRIEWTDDGWWRPVGGKVPVEGAPAPDLAPCDFALAQSDEFDSPRLGLQWFFTCPPDFGGESWSLAERPGYLRIRTRPGDLSSVSALPGVFQQRVIDKRFAFETRLEFDAADGREAAGLHLFHDPRMNLYLASSVRDGRKTIAVGKTNNGARAGLWSAPNPFVETVHLRIEVEEECARFFFGPDGKTWHEIGESVYFGASDRDLRDGRRGDPDLGWVGVEKGNTWTATTFGVFAVQDGAARPRNADFDYMRVSKTSNRAAQHAVRA